MKKQLLSICIILLFQVVQQKASAYCTPSTPNCYWDFIGNVSLGSINNASSYSQYVGYENFTSTVPACTLTTCQPNVLSVFYEEWCTSFNPGQISRSNSNNMLLAYYIAAWIDYDNNNIFDANEKLGEVNSPNSCTGVTFAINFSIPSSVSSGLKRMRVMLAYSNPGLDPCLANGGGETEDYSVYINLALPNLNIGSNSPVCVGNNIQLTSSGGASYSWVGPNGFSSNQQNPVINSVSSVADGNYQVTITGSNSCSVSTVAHVIVNDNPVPVKGSNSPVCSGLSLDLTSGGGVSYSWTGPGGFNSTAQNPSISSTTTSNSGNYTVIVTDGNGCTASASLSATIKNSPNATSGSNSPVCVGSSLQFTSGGGTSYSWTGPNSFSASINNPTISSSSTNNSGTYTVTVTGGNGCTSSSTVSVNVNARPNANAGIDQTLCVGSVCNLTGSGGTGYSWSGPNGFTSSSQNPVINSVALNQGGIYTVTVTNASSCTASSSVNITVSPLPTAVSGSNSPVCENGNIQLNSSGGTSYSWTGPNGYNSSSQNPVINNSSALLAGNYTVTVTYGNCSASSSVNVTVNPVPVFNATCNSQVCLGQSVYFNATAGYTYSWTGPNNFQSTLNNPQIHTASFGDAGNYNLTVTNSYGCSDDTSFNVSVVAIPNVVAATDSINPICVGTTLFMYANGGDTYSWTGPNGFTSSLQNPSISNVSLSGSGVYTVTASLTGGCSASATVNAIVNSNPVINVSSNSPVCAGSQVNFNSSGGNSFVWTGPGGFNSSIQNPLIQSASPANTGNYFVTATNNATGCSSTASTSVTVFQNPIVNLGNDTSFCQSTITLHAGNPGAVFLWNTQSTNANLQTSASGTYFVKVTDANGCYSTDTIQLTIYSLPSVSLNLTLDTLCQMAGSQILDGGLPVNGTYSGQGISGNNFNPDSAVIGNNAILYSYTDQATGCSNSATDSIYVNDCTGIEELSNNKNYSIYPNPFNSVLTIENFQTKGKLKIDLMSVEARLLRSWNFNGVERSVLSLEDLPAGVYFLLLKSEDITGFFRVVKQD